MENEVDGLVTYDRRVVKVDAGRVRAVNRAVIAAGSRAPRPFGSYPSLAAAYDNVGITDADPIPGDYDGGGQSYQAAGLAAAGLAPGQTVTIDRVPVTWPATAPGQPDDVVTGGQTIDVRKAGSTLVLLGAATWAPPTGETATGTITYADGSREPYQLSFNDWAATTASTNSEIVTTSPSNVQPGSGASSRRASVRRRAASRPSARRTCSPEPPRRSRRRAAPP